MMMALRRPAPVLSWVAGCVMPMAVRGLTVEAAARSLLAHEDGGYEEWGLSGNLQLDPGRLGRGLSLRGA